MTNCIPRRGTVRPIRPADISVSVSQAEIYMTQLMTSSPSDITGRKSQLLSSFICKDSAILMFLPGSCSLHTREKPILKVCSLIVFQLTSGSCGASQRRSHSARPVHCLWLRLGQTIRESRLRRVFTFRDLSLDSSL